MQRWGPASGDAAGIRALFEAGANVFRLNFSHGTHADHRERYLAIRALERETDQPISVLLDLQGPKLRLGRFVDGRVLLVEGQLLRLDLEATPGNAYHAPLPYPEIFSAAKMGDELLVDDGKVRLRITACGTTPEGVAWLDTALVVGGVVSDRKGVNVPGTVLPLSALTEKDRLGLEFGLSLGVDWVVLSFVQRAEDIVELKEVVGNRALVGLCGGPAIECDVPPESGMICRRPCATSTRSLHVHSSRIVRGIKY